MLSLKYRIIREILPHINNELVQNINKVENLKLYDVAMLCGDNEIYSNFDFEEFCNISYDNFEDFKSENATILNHIGRTSSFEIGHKKVEWLNDFCSDYTSYNTLQKKIMLIIDYVNYNYNVCMERVSYNNFSGNKQIESLSNIDYELYYQFDNCSDIEIIKTIKRDFLNELDFIKNINNTYLYIEDFKKNQIEYFKEFCEINNINKEGA